MKGHPLTNEERQRLIDLVLAGRGTKEIAEIIGCKMCTVSYHKRRLIDNNMLPDDFARIQKYKEIQDLIKEGFQMSYICDVKGVTKEEVMSIADSMIYKEKPSEEMKKFAFLQANWKFKNFEKKEKRPNVVYRGQRGKLRTPTRTDGRFQ